MFKYRVHEVAKDFKVPTKIINEILTKYADTPKNHMHILTIQELDIIFEYLTSNNQIESIDEIFADSAQAKAVPDAADESAKADTPAAQGTPAPVSTPAPQGVALRAAQAAEKNRQTLYAA